MIGYIKRLCDSFVLAIQDENTQYEGVRVLVWPQLIYDEIKELKTIDFSPDYRYDFVLIRLKVLELTRKGSFNHHSDLPKFEEIARELRNILESYSYGSSNIKVKEFPFIDDPLLKHIIQRDYKELDSILIPDGAWKSAVILSGSILEAILYDALSKDSNINKAHSSLEAPKYKEKLIPITSGKWKLVSLIKVSVDIGLLPEQRAASIDQVLRDYRNFVHPKKEIRNQHSCTEAEAYMAKGCLDGVYNHLKN